MTNSWTHIPIMAVQIADLLLQKPDGVYVDGTLGLGGHSAYFLTRLSSGARIFGFDKDAAALQMARERVADERLLTFHASYTMAHQILQEKGIAGADGVLLDLGVSSYQLDDPSRGFSILHNGPLDMRFDGAASLTAAEIVNKWPLDKLVQILRDYGEEHQAEKIALAILRVRKERALCTTQDLKQVVEDVLPRHGKTHPATQTFQALRIACNRELETVQEGLQTLEHLVLPGGRVAVLTFHSLEDRLVKNCFKNLVQGGGWRLVNKHALKPDYAEVRQNRRARSAKLRVIERSL